MIKQMFTIKRKPGMSFEEFKKYYIEKHAPLVEKTFPGLRKYVINFALQRGKETPYDAITELYWDDYETLVQLAKSDVYKTAIMADEDNFAERGSGVIVLCEEFQQK